MSRSSTWMPLYIGDYLADTGHLNAMQHGAYLLLLMHQWRTGSLPDDDVQLAAVARVDLSVWRKSVAPIVRRFFDVTPDGLSQKRCAAEKAAANAISEKRAAVGRRGAEKRWTKEEKDAPDAADTDDKSDGFANGKPMANAMAEPSVCQTQSQSQSHLPLQDDEESSSQTYSSPKRPSGSELFEEFWVAYPRKSGRGDAEKAYKAAVKAGASPADILLGVHRQVFSDDPKFIPYPATWLRGQRWLDDPKAAAPPAKETRSRLGWMSEELADMRKGAQQGRQEMAGMVNDFFDAQRVDSSPQPDPFEVTEHIGPTIDGSAE